jgi:hypothetical protein
LNKTQSVQQSQKSIFNNYIKDAKRKEELSKSKILDGSVESAKSGGRTNFIQKNIESLKMIKNKALVKKLNKSGEVIKKVNTSQIGYSRKNFNNSQIYSEVNSMT